MKYEALGLLGVGLVVGGVALMHAPSALIVSGLCIFVFAAYGAAGYGTHGDNRASDDSPEY